MLGVDVSKASVEEKDDPTFLSGLLVPFTASAQQSKYIRFSDNSALLFKEQSKEMSLLSL